MDKAKKVFTSNVVLAILIAALVGLTISIISGFKYTYMTNDDYMISLMTANGDNKCIFVNFFLTSFMVVIQKLFAGINCFALSEIVFCLLSLTVINYVFLSKFKNYVGVIFCLVVDSIVYCTSVIMIQYTQTTSICCSAGVLLLLHSFLSETGKRYGIIQRIIGCLLIVIGSMYRFESFYLICIFSNVLLLCVLLGSISSHHRKGDSWINTVKSSVFSNLKMIISLLLVIVLAFGCFFLSDMIKKSDQDYVDHLELGRGRQYVTDYYVAPFEGNEDFYRSIGVDSVEDYELITSGYIDKDYMNADRMIAIGEFSLKEELGNNSKFKYAINQYLHSVKSTIKQYYRMLLKIKNKLSLPVSNKLFFFIVLLLIFLLGIIGIVLLLVYKKKHQRFRMALFLVKAMLVLFWICFFAVYGIIIKNILLLAAFSIVLLMIYNSGKKQVFFFALFSVLLVGIYCYQISFRLNYRALFTFAFPAIVFLLFLYEKPLTKQSKALGFNGIRKSIAVVLLLAIVLASTVMSEIKVWKELFIDQTASYDSTASDYLSENKDTEFAHVVSANAVIDPAYYNSFLVPKLSENSILYGSWCISSDYYDKLLEKKGIDSLFEQMINNDRIYLLLQLDEKMDVVRDYEVYLNNHYTQPNEVIELRSVKKMESSAELWGGDTKGKKIGIFQIVSEKCTYTY